MNSTENFKRVISQHLEGLAASDELFAATLQKPEKSIDACVTYILNEVKKSGSVAFTDEEVFGMAVHYYDEDGIAVGQPIRCHVVSNQMPELTEEEKRQAKQDAINNLVIQEQEKLRAQRSKKIEERKQVVEQPSLFD
jgi:hypothetical protein